MLKNKLLTFTCDNSKCMIPKKDNEKDFEYFKYKSRDWYARDGYNTEEGTYIYVEEDCPRCGRQSRKYYYMTDLFYMLMQEVVDE